MKTINQNTIEGNPTIFANGVFISPRKFVVDGRDVWRWVVESFEDDCFYEGRTINIVEYATTKDGLFEIKEDE